MNDLMIDILIENTVDVLENQTPIGITVKITGNIDTWTLGHYIHKTLFMICDVLQKLYKPNCWLVHTPKSV